MTTETVTGALVARDKPGARAMIESYRADFGTVLPSHIKPETWVRVAQGALKKGKKVQCKDGVVRTELEAAAINNPGVFLASMLEAARLGLEPGTEQYYLTPRKVQGRLEILGIVGYQGYIELMYRAGAVSSVVAEVVYEGEPFSYKPNRDAVPDHDIDWEKRGDDEKLRLVYAYARMKGGATSKVVVLNGAQIAKIRSKSQGSDSKYSPWQTNPESMWLKSAVRRLRKWVPTSAEYVQPSVQVESQRDVAPVAPLAVEADYPEVAEYSGEVFDGELVDEGDLTPEEIAEHVAAMEAGQ